jgi:hypothetical protein
MLNRKRLCKFLEFLSDIMLFVLCINKMCFFLRVGFLSCNAVNFGKSPTFQGYIARLSLITCMAYSSGAFLNYMVWQPRSLCSS